MKAKLAGLATAAILITACTGGATQIVTVTAPAPSGTAATGPIDSPGPDSAQSSDLSLDESLLLTNVVALCDELGGLRLTGLGTTYREAMVAKLAAKSFQSNMLRQPAFPTSPYAQDVLDAAGDYVTYAEWLSSKAIEISAIEMLTSGNANYEWPKGKDQVGPVEMTISATTGATPPIAASTVEQQIATACVKVPEQP